MLLNIDVGEINYWRCLEFICDMIKWVEKFMMKIEELKLKIFFIKDIFVNLGIILFNCIVKKVFLFVYSSGLNMLNRFYVY